MNPKINDVHRFDDWVALPLDIRERKVKWWVTGWYIEPLGLEWLSGSLVREESEWGKFYAYTKMAYPIQSFLRQEVAGWYSYQKRNYIAIENWIKDHIRNPRRKLIKATFTRQWQDLPSIVVNFHLNCIVEYVDHEKCFEVIEWNHDPVSTEKAKQIKEIYDYAKTGREALQKKLEIAYSEVTPRRISNGDMQTYEAMYKHVNAIEAEIELYDTKCCEWVVNNRAILWT